MEERMEQLVQILLTFFGAPEGVIVMSVLMVMAFGAASQKDEHMKAFFIAGVICGIFALWGAIDWLG